MNDTLGGNRAGDDDNQSNLGNGDKSFGYAIKGVEFSYLRIADIVQFSESTADGATSAHIEVLYAIDKTKGNDFLAAIGLENGKNRYANADHLDNTKFFYQSAVLIDALTAALTANATTVKNALETYIAANGGTAMPLTNEYGMTKAENLDLGLYLFVESKLPENVTTSCNPFLLSIPMTDVTGGNSNDGGVNWLYDITLYPKNLTGIPSLEKTLRENNLFFDSDTTYGKSWGLKEFLDRWNKKLIIVGMECGHKSGQRLGEYSPYSADWGFMKGITGTGEQTFQWICRELKPLIDREFRTYPHRSCTAVAGSSMGASWPGMVRCAITMCFQGCLCVQRCGLLHGSGGSGNGGKPRGPGYPDLPVLGYQGGRPAGGCTAGGPSKLGLPVQPPRGQHPGSTGRSRGGPVPARRRTLRGGLGEADPGIYGFSVDALKAGGEMIGLGTIINTAAILAGGILGALFGKFLNDSTQNTLTRVCGVSTLFIGICGALEQMVTVTGEGISTGGSMLLIGCLTIGAVIGELLNIEEGFERLGSWLKVKSGSSRDHRFVDAFVTASLTVCIGAMAVVGSIQDGLTGDYSVLATKAVLDLIIIMVMSSSMGRGAVFSAVPVAVLQGSITALAGLLRPVMTGEALSNLSLVGNVLIFCVGINLVWDKKIKVANLLPAIVLAVAAAFL